MKNIILVIGLALFSVTAFSQTLMTGSNDTVVDTGTKTNTLILKGKKTSVSIQSIVTKITGTVAGTLTVQGSLDGINFSTIDTNVMKTNLNTFTATDVASQNTTFIVNGSPYIHYRVSYTGSGTMSASIKSFIFGR